MSNNEFADTMRHVITEWNRFVGSEDVPVPSVEECNRMEADMTVYGKEQIVAATVRLTDVVNRNLNLSVPWSDAEGERVVRETPKPLLQAVVDGMSMLLCDSPLTNFLSAMWCWEHGPTLHDHRGLTLASSRATKRAPTERSPASHVPVTSPRLALHGGSMRRARLLAPPPPAQTDAQHRRLQTACIAETLIDANCDAVRWH